MRASPSAVAGSPCHRLDRSAAGRGEVAYRVATRAAERRASESREAVSESFSRRVAREDRSCGRTVRLRRRVARAPTPTSARSEGHREDESLPPPRPRDRRNPPGDRSAPADFGRPHWLALRGFLLQGGGRAWRPVPDRVQLLALAWRRWRMGQERTSLSVPASLIGGAAQASPEGEPSQPPRRRQRECQSRKAPSSAASAAGSSCLGVSRPASSIVFRICSR